MTLHDIWLQLVNGLLATTWLEFIAVAFGIASVVFSRKENILVYPTGLVNTIIFIYLSMVAGLYAEAGVNLYYTAMSLIGWFMWTRKGADHAPLRITSSSLPEWLVATGFFVLCWFLLYMALSRWTDSTVPLADAFASATAYTGMLLMARKKLESWIWWALTNTAAIPLYFVKGLAFTSFQYLVFLVLSVMGYLEWLKRLSHGTKNATEAPKR
ncbi:MAG: nicotinamide riboside transporter PnuC [Saprospiraceae bacterium]